MPAKGLIVRYRSGGFFAAQPGSKVVFDEIPMRQGHCRVGAVAWKWDWVLRL
jgi:hypothetical protein